MKFSALLLCLLLTGCFGSAHHLSSSNSAAFSAMIADLMPAKVVFVGEFHDQRDHHILQLNIIRELHRQGAQLAIGLEMFDIEKQQTLDEWVGGRLPLQDFVAKYSKGWNINWTEYDSIMLFARNNRIPLVALDAPPVIVRLVTHGGNAALGQEAMQHLPAGVSTLISPSYRKFMSQAFQSHTIPVSLFDNFCAAQGLRNSTMAKGITGYLARHPDRKMVVIAGIGHAMRRAVPSLLENTGLLARIVIPKVEGLYEELERSDVDYFVTTGE